MNIAEAQLIRQLLARVQALEFAVEELEARERVEMSGKPTLADLVERLSGVPEVSGVVVKRKPGRPRKQQ